ncbi:ATP synthase F1 subunit delta [Sinanaerobacter chloroacetimidivorans]|uniref:ATP synthase subunit delta n=1 Tax=Sinanaerobacter chloroacetimidivorans TaxID=2818044 RepID=A0A8J8B2D3_9FIRM|nr:ATP synthase F1 subunit delta [Sinanaerobacter chloroacetimidivorans]MBR0599184.1 ATP synthase F1 subunit delta [Sinanaerobacter chloroacetimidivorans]
MAELTVDLTYGKALLLAATDVNKTEVILEEAKELLKILDLEPEFREFLSTPVVSAAEKKKVIADIFTGKICDELLNLLFILVDKGRAREFSNIIRKYKQLLDESRGYSIGTLFSVKLLSQEQLEIFEEKTGKLIQKKVKLENKIDTSIIGGVRIFIEGKVIDATIKKRLKDLSESLR